MTFPQTSTNQTPKGWFGPREGYLDLERGFGYRQIPKCGTTSLLNALRAERIQRLLMADEQGRQLEMPVHEWGRHHAGPLHQVDYRYIVVRDPIERFLSAFSNKVLSRRILKKGLDEANLKPFFILMRDKRMSPMPDVNSFVTHLDFYLKNWLLYQHMKPLVVHLEGTPLSFFTEVFRADQLDHLTQRIGSHLGIDFKIEHLQKTESEKKVLLSDLSAESFQKLLDYYRDDYVYLDSLFPIGRIEEAWARAQKS